MKSNWFFTLTISVTFISSIFSDDVLNMSLQSTTNQRRRILLQIESDVTIDVIIDGEDGRPPVVLLPSSIRDSEDFDNVAERIANGGYLVLRPQPRGMGDSRGPVENFTLHTLADDVATTIRQLGKGIPAIIVGHAFGHYVARVTDLDHSSLVRGVVIAAGEQRYQNDPSLRVSLDCASNTSLPRDERLQHLYHAFFVSTSDASVWLSGWYPELRSFYRNAAQVPPKSEWWPITHSLILDLQATEDPWRPSQSRNELKDKLGSFVTVQVIEGASHALFPEQPEKVADAILNWIATLTSR